jgi:hypothetical protein
MKKATSYGIPPAIVWPVVAGLLLLACGSWVHAGQAVVLITEREAAMKDAPREAPAATIMEKDAMKGPMIIVHSPKAGETYPAPLVVDLNFQPQPETAVDIHTLQVIYRKIIPIDITDRIRPYATEKGIYIPEADIPEGRHNIQIRIADTRGNVSVRDLTFSVQ